MNDPVYVIARSVLLDALDALGEHRDALVLVGAQAVYLHAGDDDLPVAPFTSDGDLAIDTTLLRDEPALEAALERANFRREKQDTVGIWTTLRPVASDDQRPFSVDLLVPSSSKRRAARLPGHDLRVARNVEGLEGALVDHEMMDIASLEPSDNRSHALRVAGPGALIVAKVYKIHERTERGRLKDKDAFDVYRLLRHFETKTLGERVRRLMSSERASDVARIAMERFAEQFAAPDGVGVEMTLRSVEGLVDPAETRAACIALARDLIETVQGAVLKLNG